jgi:hypothetical protein
VHRGRSGHADVCDCVGDAGVHQQLPIEGIVCMI